MSEENYCYVNDELEVKIWIGHRKPSLKCVRMRPFYSELPHPFLFSYILRYVSFAFSVVSDDTTTKGKISQSAQGY